jgi:hypothetical protein
MNDTNATTGTMDFSVLGFAQRLGRVMDPSFCLFSAKDTEDVNEADVEALAPHTPSSAAARRLAIAFGVVGSLGMPERMRLELFTDWATTLFARAPHGEARMALVRVVEFAQVIAAQAEPEAYPNLSETLLQMDFAEPSGSELEGEDDTADSIVEAATWLRHAIERYTRDSDSPQPTDTFRNWSRAADMLGSVERAGGDAAIAACMQAFRARVLSWAARAAI